MANSEKIENINKIEIDIGYEDVIYQIAKDCKNEIVNNCKSHDWEKYEKEWDIKIKKDKSTHKYYYVVYNKKHYRLTHLLENGHLIVNKKGGVGFSAPRVHIKPAYDKANKEVDTKIKKATITIK